MAAKLIFEESRTGRRAYSIPGVDVPIQPIDTLIPDKFQRTSAPRLPEVSENQAVRHYVNLSVKNHHVDKDFYPLGSCTMKYNPKVNEDMARLPGFAMLHPLQVEPKIQGALELMYRLDKMLCGIFGMAAVSLQPVAGSQGELAGLLIARKYHEQQGDIRTKVLIPDSAHGTNPASVRIAGFEAVPVASTERGRVDLDDLRSKLDTSVAAIMLTNPNTLGLFEDDIETIAALVHEQGGLLYMDGANLNALMGIARPGDMGFDIVHTNLHKTFSTPHGGGGPGSGPVGVVEKLIPYLPSPRIREQDGVYFLESPDDASIGRFHAFYGNFGMMVRAYTYIRMLGREGVAAVSRNAIINANYLRTLLQDVYPVPHPGPCMHEFVASGEFLRVHDIRTTDVAKRLLDFGFHAPTTYFPLIVKEALMIEPTECESREDLERFADAMLQIAKEAETDPDKLREAPVTTPVSRLQEAQAARNLDIRYTFDNADNDDVK
jgi:glycine dehydrogenase subunit 2